MYDLSEHQSLSAAVWWQQSNRDIPGYTGHGIQRPGTSGPIIRSTLQWTWLNAVSRWQVRSAWFSEYLHFTSPIAEIDAIYRLKTRAVEATFRRQLGRAFSLDAGVSGRLLLADVPYYESNESRKEGAAYISGLFSPARNKWRYVLTIRQDLAEGYKVPFCFSAGAEGPFAENLSARFSFSRNYRVPTLNDRFWQPGGNPDLKPESSWNQEAGRSGATTVLRS
jgi:iron complex outermembrane receptor protein